MLMFGVGAEDAGCRSCGFSSCAFPLLKGIQMRGGAGAPKP